MDASHLYGTNNPKEKFFKTFSQRTKLLVFVLKGCLRVANSFKNVNGVIGQRFYVFSADFEKFLQVQIFVNNENFSGFA